MSRRLVVAAIAVLALQLVPLASAHATLQSADPPIDTVRRLDHAPDSITLTFRESLDASSTASVMNMTPPAHRVDLGIVVSRDPPTIRIALPSGLPPGIYAVQYHTVSAVDGHPWGGSLGFAIGDYTPPDSTSQSVNDIDGAAVSGRALLYVGLALVFGALAFAAWMPEGVRPSTAATLLLGATLHIVGLLVLMGETYRTSQAATLQQYLASDAGKVYLFRALVGAGAWILAVLGAFRSTRTGPWAVGLLTAGAALGSSRLGHASGNGPAAIAFDLAHLLSAGIWVGGLLLFTWALLRRRDVPRPDVQAAGVRFGTLAMTAVIVLALTGIVLAVYTVGWSALSHPLTLVRGAYGAALGLKVFLGLVMVGLAGINRYVLLEQPTSAGFTGFAQRATAGLTAGRVKAGLADGTHLGRSVAIEAILGVVVLCIAGVLTSVSPPPPAAAAPQTLTATGSDVDYTVTAVMSPTPTRAGSSDVTFTIAHIRDDGSTEPVANNTCGRASCVSVVLAYADGAQEPARNAQLIQGQWVVSGVLWSAAGPAQFNVTLSWPPATFQDTVTVPFSIDG